MASVGVGYDTGASIYSPAGRVFQVEYAEKAVEKLDTVVGIRCKDGVVLGVEKTIPSKMLVENTFRRVFNVAKHAGMAVGGVLADGRRLVDRAREEASNYKKQFGIQIPGSVLAQRIALYVHAYTEYWHLRPFGCSILLAVLDEMNGSQLFMIDPSGTCHRYRGIAVGKGQQQARVELEKIDFDKITCKEAADRIGGIIYSVHDDAKDKPFELELSWICDDSKRIHGLVPKETLASAKKAGEEAIRDEDSDDEEDDDDE